MTKVINRKLVSVLMAVIFICTAIIPVHAEESMDETIFNGPSIECLGEGSALQARGVTKITGRGFTVYPAKVEDGVMTYYDAYGETSTGSGYTPNNCYVSKTLQNNAIALGCDYLVIEMTFSVEGTGTMWLEFESNGNKIIDGTIYQPDWYTIMWHTPMSYSTYGLNISGTGNSSYYLGGHISLL